MPQSVISYLVDQPFMTILRALLLSSRPRHLRELSAQFALSPSGVSDILRRMRTLGILREVRIKNRRCFSVELPKEEAEYLKAIFSYYQTQMLKQRSLRFRDQALKKFAWIDEAQQYTRQLKGKKPRQQPR